MKEQEKVKMIKDLISEKSELLSQELTAAIGVLSSSETIELLTAQISLLDEMYREIEEHIEPLEWLTYLKYSDQRNQISIESGS